MSFLLNKRVFFTSLIALSSVAQAQPEEGFTIAPSIGYYNTDNHRSVKDDTALSLGLGYQFGNPWAIEFVYLNADSEVDQFRLDGLYHLEEYNQFIPYLAAGVGSTDFNSDSNNALINAGGGLKYALNDSLSLRGDFRLIKDIEGHELDHLTTIGLHFVFGSSHAKAATAVVKEKIATVKAENTDADNDGVKDANDLCLTTPTGVSVDTKGCALDGDKDSVADYKDICLTTPANISVDAKGCALDGDKDGVADYKDICLTTPANISVDAKGCALDGDKDGVADYKDICLTTPANISVDAKGCALDDDKDGVANHIDMCANSAAGAKVDAKGCYVVLESQKSVRLDVQFGNNSVIVDQKYYSQIEEVAGFLTEYPNTNAVIEGHTDDRGSASYNQAISEKRAQAIVDVIVNSFGISAERISAVGYGEEQPLLNNDTESNRSINRRVTAVISSK